MAGAVPYLDGDLGPIHIGEIVFRNKSHPPILEDLTDVIPKIIAV